ncbi:MAG: hypothetical protein QME48_07030 [bacterium]|nr:hypothetical protein [bacterium]
MKERILTFDLIRGIAIIFIIFFHSSIYNYDKIHLIDFSNPPLFIVLISFMALWGGIFIIYSSILNTFIYLKRDEKNENSNFLKLSFFTFLFYILIHFSLNLVFGRWNIDFVNNTPSLTFIGAFLRDRISQFHPYEKLFDGSSISTIAFNILFIAFLQSFFKKIKLKRNVIYIFLFLTSFITIFLSFTRVSLYGYFSILKERNNFLPSLLLTFFLSNPYPLITYFSYGLFGMLIGYLIFDGRDDILKKIILPSSILLILYGIYGITKFPKTISKADYFWYFKTNFELGFFILSIISFYLILEKRNAPLKKLSFVYNFSRVSLSVYLLEVLLSELFRKFYLKVNKGWNMDMNATFLFGFFNVIIWVIIVNIWSKFNFKYSFEYFWVKIFKILGKDSTKLKI